MEPLLVGIDVGTSNVKICVFNVGGELVKSVSDNVILNTPAQGHAEIDLDDLMKKVKILLGQAVSGNERRVEAIGFSVSSPTLVLMDKEYNPVRPGIPYLDNRASKEVSLIVEKMGDRKSYLKNVGNNPSPSTCTAALINWLKKNEPDNWSRTYKIGFLNSFLAARFTGNVIIDPTTASYSGLMNVRKPDNWDDELISISGIDRQILPEIKPSFHKVGELNRAVAQATGLREGITVSIGSADTAAASFAMGLKKHGDAFESMGTSEVLTICLSKPDLSGAYMNRSHVVPGLWLCHGAMSTPGAAMSWAVNNIFPDLGSVKRLEEEAVKSKAGANGLIFLPYLSGERSPVFDSKACGLFFGLTLNTNRADMARAVYEGAGYGMRQIYSIAKNMWNIKPEYIKCVGGAARSNLALQVRADALNTEFRSIESDHASAYGAALLGGVAAGIYDIDNVPCLDTFSRTVAPIPENVKIYNRFSKVYDELYPNLKDLMHIITE